VATDEYVSVLLSDGAGPFGAKTDFATGEVSRGREHGDGNLDLAEATGTQ
jgi:hypothetical protein